MSDQGFMADEAGNVRDGAGTIVAAPTKRGWWATMSAPGVIRDAILSLPDRASAQDIARKANEREEADRA